MVEPEANPYLPPAVNADDTPDVPFRVGNSGRRAVLLAVAHGLLVLAALEWLLFLDLFSYGIGPDNWWIEDFRVAVMLCGALGVIAMGVGPMLIRIPFWVTCGCWSAWALSCLVWLHVFFRECVTRGGHYTAVATPCLLLFSFTAYVYTHQLAESERRAAMRERTDNLCVDDPSGLNSTSGS